MERIDFIKLKTVVSDPSSSARNVNNSVRCYPEYNALISNYIIKHNSFKEKESALHIMSMQNWITKKEVQTSRTAPKIGEIWLADLGSNYKPECSYPHPVLILEIVGNMVYVVPGTTSPRLVAQAYHPVDNETGSKFFRKVGRTDGFSTVGTLILSNARSISKGRLLDRKGTMQNISDPTSVFYEIKDKCFQFCFPKQYIELLKSRDKIEELEEDKNILTQENIDLKKEKEQFQQEKDELLQKIFQLQQEIEKNIGN